jgi:hypothetical protein
VRLGNKENTPSPVYLHFGFEIRSELSWVLTSASPLWEVKQGVYLFCGSKGGIKKTRFLLKNYREVRALMSALHGELGSGTLKGEIIRRESSIRNLFRPQRFSDAVLN